MSTETGSLRAPPVGQQHDISSTNSMMQDRMDAVPVEVWHRIFDIVGQGVGPNPVELFPPEISHTSEMVVKFDQNTMNLSHVCRSWRARHAMWACVHLRVCNPGTAMVEEFKKFVISNIYPIHVEILQNQQDNAVYRALAEILEAAITKFDCFTSIRCYSDNSDALKPLIDIQAEKLRHFRYIGLNVPATPSDLATFWSKAHSGLYLTSVEYHHYQPNIRLQPRPEPEAADSTQTLASTSTAENSEIQTVTTQSIPTTLHDIVPIRQLTSIQVTEATMEMVIDMLSMVSGIQNLRVGHMTGTHSARGNQLVVPSLRSLIIEGSENSNPLFGTLRTPSLTRLGFGQIAGKGHHGLQEFLGQFGNQLRFFAFKTEGGDCSAMKILVSDLLGPLTQLGELWIDFSENKVGNLMGDLFNELSRRSTWLPQLHTAKFTADHVSPGPMTSWLGRRPKPAMKKFTLVIHEGGYMYYDASIEYYWPKMRKALERLNFEVLRKDGTKYTMHQLVREHKEEQAED